jgi:hypothetical protein
MKRLLLALAAVATAAAIVFAVLYFTAEPATKTVTAEPCGDRIFGYVKSLEQKGDLFELRFDPAWFTSGETANAAAAEDGAVEPGQPVPNDNYVVNESHRLYTYLVPNTTPVTVLTRGGDPVQFGATPITLAQLAQLVRGEKPVTLFEGLDTGFWMRVHVDTVCSLDQQYKP